MQPITKIHPLLKEVKNIVITTHYGPDGDAIGSSLGLQIYLQKFGHNVVTIVPSKCPDFIEFLPETDTLINFEAMPLKAEKALEKADILFCLDFNTFHRTRDLKTLLEDSNAIKVLIDHHLEPAIEDFDYGWSDPESSSTCEMVYHFIVAHTGKEHFDMDMMTLLYTGVVTDTGSFRYERATGDLHRMIAFFKDSGLNHTKIHEQLFNTWSENRLKFLGHVLAERLHVFPNLGWSYMAIKEEDFIKFNVKKEDIEGFVNYGLTIKGIHSTVLLSQRGNQEVRLSFRSNIGYDVRTIASTHFMGGGHENAAGGTFHGTLEDAINHLKQNVLNQ